MISWTCFWPRFLYPNPICTANQIPTTSTNKRTLCRYWPNTRASSPLFKQLHMSNFGLLTVRLWTAHTLVSVYTLVSNFCSMPDWPAWNGITWALCRTEWRTICGPTSLVNCGHGAGSLWTCGGDPVTSPWSCTKSLLLRNVIVPDLSWLPESPLAPAGTLGLASPGTGRASTGSLLSPTSAEWGTFAGDLWKASY